jgi:hypothetical protein
VKYKCFKIQCPVCRDAGSIQLFINKKGEVRYARTRHYLGNGKFSYCKIEDTEALKTLLKSQGISMSTDKANNGSMGQGQTLKLHDIKLKESSLIQQNKGGRRLVGLGHKP